MNILVLGCNGMLGHAVFNILGKTTGHDIWGTCRGVLSPEDCNQVISGVDAYDFHNITAAIDRSNPEVIINCIGIIKQSTLSNNLRKSIQINALLPHLLNEVCVSRGIRMIHISTDCVFSGLKGNYAENDLSDAFDIYGKTKFLGEVNSPNAITLRTSIIGRELVNKTSLLEWVLAQKNEIKGYRRAIFSGVTTVELAIIIRDYLLATSWRFGIYNIASNPISKYDLIVKLCEHYKKIVSITPDDAFVIDRTLNAKKFIDEYRYSMKGWDEQILEMIDYEKFF